MADLTVQLDIPRLVRFSSVEESAGGRTYATDLKGQAYFPRTKEMELEGKAYGIIVSKKQTKTTNEAGELVDVPLEQQTIVHIITGAFEKKEDAFKAMNEDKLLNIEAATDFNKQLEAMGLTPEKLKALEGAI